MKIVDIVRKVNKLFHLRIYVCSSISFKQFCLMERMSQYILLESRKKMKVFPLAYLNEEKQSPQTTMCPEHYMAIISNALVIGMSSIVKASINKIIYDLAYSSDTRYRLTDCGFIWKNIYNTEKASPLLIGGRYFVRCFDYGRKMEAAINLCGNYSFNYYHFLYEIIAKFYLIEKTDIPNSVPIVIDDIVRKIPQFAEILDIFNKGRSVIYLRPLEKCSIKKLYNFSSVHLLPPNFWDVNEVRLEDVVFDFNAIIYMRDKILRCNDISSCERINKYPKKLFILRKSNFRRYNEDELLKIAEEYGYIGVSPEKLSFKDQVFLFSNAESIVGSSGAAFSNIVCCKKGCKILVLMAMKNKITAFSTIAGMLELEMEYLCGRPVDSYKLHTDFTVNREDFKKFLTN